MWIMLQFWSTHILHVTSPVLDAAQIDQGVLNKTDLSNMKQVVHANRQLIVIVLVP